MPRRLNILLVVSGDTYDDCNRVHVELTKLHMKWPIDLIVHEDHNAGKFASAWSRVNSVPEIIMPSLITHNKKFYKAKAERIFNLFSIRRVISFGSPASPYMRKQIAAHVGKGTIKFKGVSAK